MDWDIQVKHKQCLDWLAAKGYWATYNALREDGPLDNVEAYEGLMEE